MTRTFREIIEDAERQVDTYKSPDVSEARDCINAILDAADLSCISPYDKIESITIGDGELGVVEIKTSYSIRQCEQTGEFEFPAWLLDEEHPLVEAKKWGLREKIAEAEQKVDAFGRSLENAERALARLKSALAQTSH